MSRATIDPAAIEARVRQRIAERGLPPEQAELVFAKIRPKLETAGLLPAIVQPPSNLRERIGDTLGAPRYTPGRPEMAAAARASMMPFGAQPTANTDPLVEKYSRSGGGFTSAGGATTTYNTDATGRLVGDNLQIDPSDYGNEILAASRTVTPAEVAAMRQEAVTMGGSLDTQPDELVAVLVAERKRNQGRTFTSGGPTVNPNSLPGVAANSPAGEIARAIPGVRQARDFAYGAASGAIVNPGAAIMSTIGAGADLAGFRETGQDFATGATNTIRQGPQGTGAPFALGQIAGNIAPAITVPMTGGGSLPLVMGLMGTQGFGAGVQEYRAAREAAGTPIDPQEQALVGLAFAAVETLTERMGIGKFLQAMPSAAGALRALSANPSKAAAGEVLRVLGPVIATNTLEEGAAQLGQNAIAKGVYDPGRDVTEGVGGAMAAGAAGGLMMGAPSAGLAGMNAAFQARMQADQARQRPTKADKARQVVSETGQTLSETPATPPTMPTETPVVEDDTEAVDPAEAAVADRVDGLLAILEDDTQSGSPEYEAARAELDALFPGFGDEVAPSSASAPGGVGELLTPLSPLLAPSPVGLSPPNQRGPSVIDSTEQGMGPVGVDPILRRVDRPNRPTVTINPDAVSGFNPSETPNSSRRFRDLLGPFPTVPEVQQQGQSPTMQEQPGNEAQRIARPSPVPQAQTTIQPPARVSQTGSDLEGSTPPPSSEQASSSQTSTAQRPGVAQTPVEGSSAGLAGSAPSQQDTRDSNNPAKPDGSTVHKFSSTQLDLPENIAANVKAAAARIPNSDLAEDGRETAPHITVKYGLKTDDAAAVRAALAGVGPIRVRLGKTSLFENEDADVVKVDVHGAQLRRVNKLIAAAIENEDTHPKYNPHVTLAYVKKGRGKKYSGDASFDGQEITIDELTFSDRNGLETTIKLGETVTETPSSAGQRAGISDSDTKPAAQGIFDFVERIESEARERIAKTPRALPRGKGGRAGATSLPQLLRDHAIIVAAKVVKSGVKGYLAIRQAVNEAIAQAPKDVQRRRAQVGKEAMAILRDSRDDKGEYTRFEDAISRRVNGEPVTAKETREAVRETDGTAKDAPTVTEAEAIKARYKGETKAANAADRAARKEERTKATMNRRQRAEVSRFQLGQLRDTLKAVASNKANAAAMVNVMLQRTADQLDAKLTREEMSKGLREQLIRTITDTLPVAVRGKLLTDVRDVRTLAGMAKALGKARKALAMYEGRAAIVDARRNSKAKVLAGLTEARRAAIDTLIQEVGAAKQMLMDAKTADQAEDAARKLRDAADKIIQQITEHRNENAVIRGQERADAGEWVNKVVNRLKRRHSLRPRDERGKLQQRAWTERSVMTMLDGETFAMKLDDHFTDDVNDDISPVRRLLYDDLTQAQNRKFEIVEKAVGELDVLAKKAGYSNMHDALRVLGDDVLGEASTQYIDVKVGGRSSIPLGVALKIYALDPETKLKAINGRRFKFVDDITGKSAFLTPGVFAAVTRAIPLELRRFVDAAKDVRDALRGDLFAAHRMMKGYEPIAVDGYEPTRVDPWSTNDDIDLGNADSVKKWLDGFDVKQWENSGFLQNRQNNASAPLLLTNWANDLVRSIDGAASVIALAQAVRNARVVMGSQPVTSTLSDIFGIGAVKRVQELVAIASGVSMSPSHLFGRFTEAMTRNVSRSLTQFSEQSYLKQLGGLFKLAAEMPASAVARGLRGMLSMGAREEMLRNSAYLRARSSLPGQALFAQLGASGALPTEGSAKAAGRAIAASSREAGRRLLKLQLGRAAHQVGDILSKSMPALLDTISLAQWFDQLPARMAWAGFNGTGSNPATAAEQTEKAMRRSANPSNSMDQSGFAIMMRRSGFGFMVAFTGDPFKSFAQLYRANQVGGAYRAKVYAGVLGNVLWSALVTVGLKKGAEAIGRLISGEDDEEETLTDAAERVAWLAGKDLAGIVPFGSNVASIVEIAAKRNGFKTNVIDAPISGAVNRAVDGMREMAKGIQAMFESRTAQEQERMVDDLLGGLWKSGVGLASLLGLPLPVVDRIQRNIRAGMKERPLSDDIQAFEEAQGGPTKEQKKDITRARQMAVDAIMAGNAKGLREAVRDMEQEGKKPTYRMLRDSVESAHPLARVAKGERDKFLKSLKPDKRAEVLREVKAWEKRRGEMYELWKRAQR